MQGLVAGLRDFRRASFGMEAEWENRLQSPSRLAAEACRLGAAKAKRTDKTRIFDS